MIMVASNDSNDVKSDTYILKTIIQKESKTVTKMLQKNLILNT